MAPPDVLGASEISPPSLDEEAKGNSSPTTTCSSIPSSSSLPPVVDCQFMIAGGGIVGLVLALCLEKDLGIVPHVYEQADAFSFDIGAGMGCYPNGLRVLRHVSPQLCARVQAAGYPYLFRRFDRHDGTTVAMAQESKLSGNDDDDDDALQSIGIRRARLQQALYEASMERQIPIYFGKRVAKVKDQGNNVQVTFEDGTVCRTEFLFATDGARSQVRAQVVGRNDMEEQHHAASPAKQNDKATGSPIDPAAPPGEEESVATASTTSATKNGLKVNLSSRPHSSTTKNMEETPQLCYTGVTCLMGLANVARPQRGICFPSSLSSRFHAVFFPTGPDEQCFQLHVPMDEDKAVQTWGTLSTEEAQKECRALAQHLRADGWHEDYLQPLEHVTRAVRIGFALLQPRLKRWVYGSQKRIVLLGDAAHPPVPYLGQGAQMGLEDAGILSLLMKRLCMDIDGKFQTTNFGTVAKIFQHMRIPRTRSILDNSKFWGKVQQQRAENNVRNHARETLIKRDIFFHEALPILFPGAVYDFVEAVERELAKNAVHLAMVKEEG